MKKLLLLVPMLSLFPLSPAFSRDFGAAADDKAVFTKAEISAAAADPRLYTIDPKSIWVELVSKTTSAGPKVTAEDRGIPGNIMTIINVASKIWKIIKENAPVVGVETKYAAAVPEGATSPNQLCEWKGPETYEYKFHAKNLYGGEVVTVTYKVLFAYGGKFDNKGAYLTGVTVVPGAINVSWGYKLFMSAFVADTTIVNIGTYADPKAAMQLKLSSKIASVLKEWNGNSVYLINGGGELKEIVSPFNPEIKAEDLASAAPLFNPEKVFGR
ncbi:MAG: hypothetical protein Q7R35_04940 [Elusimicrobiota bacterium]|nr:hypothetical protein [Elusimicrobiota bacterium]